MLILPLIAGASLIGAGLWLKAEDTEQARLQVELEKLRAQQRSSPSAPGAPGGLSDLVPAAIVIGAVSALMILRR